MARAHDLTIPAHPNVYLSSLQPPASSLQPPASSLQPPASSLQPPASSLQPPAEDRHLKIYFSEPDAGVNADTGLLLLIAGFGATANSNVYKKMRRQFADEYNLVTISCDYFGNEFMQMPESVFVDIDELEQMYTAEDAQAVKQADDPMAIVFELAAKYQRKPELKAQFQETLANFNDMGIMQAIDNVSAVLALMRILEDNQLAFNRNKVMIYGHSHGAYLGYLCNALAPHLFSHLIDNSAWLLPLYLQRNRLIALDDGLKIWVTYFAKNHPCDFELLHLAKLYKKFTNVCQIIAYHGTQDQLLAFKAKQAFAEQVAHMDLRVVDASMLGEVFATTKHGLDADFLKMFALVMPEISPRKTAPPPCDVVTYTTSSARYVIDYRQGLPLLHVF